MHPLITVLRPDPDLRSRVVRGVLLALGVGILVLTGCSSGERASDLSTLYNREAQYHGVERDPIILIPGLIGSKLTHAPADTTVWGAFRDNLLYYLLVHPG